MSDPQPAEQPRELRDAVTEALVQMREEKKSSEAMVHLVVTPRAFQALLKQQFQTTPAGDVVVSADGGIISRSIEWGAGTSTQIAHFASGVVELQQSLLQTLQKLRKEPRKDTK